MRLASRLLAAATIAASLVASSAAQAQSFGFSLSGSGNVFTPKSVTVGPVAATDLFFLTISGQVFLQGSTAYGTNAAGVVTTAGTTGVGGTSTCNCFAPGSNYGSVLMSVNGGAWFQIFAANPSNGLGSLTPPSTLSISSVTVQSFFGGALASNSTLEFRVADSDNFNNDGAFEVSGAFRPTSTVPEPATSALLAVGLGAMVFVARRRRA